MKTNLKINGMVFLLGIFLFACTNDDNNIYPAAQAKAAKPLVNSFDINPALNLKTGESKVLAVAINLSDGSRDANLIWNSMNSVIAKVDENGRITGLKEGITKIEAKSKNDPTLKIYFLITVLKP